MTEFLKKEINKHGEPIYIGNISHFENVKCIYYIHFEHGKYITYQYTINSATRRECFIRYTSWSGTEKDLAIKDCQELSNYFMKKYHELRITWSGKMYNGFTLNSVNIEKCKQKKLHPNYNFYGSIMSNGRYEIIGIRDGKILDD